MIPVVFGLSGPVLTPDERDFFRDVDPAGYILFRRNCVDRAQLRALTDDLRTLHGRDDLPVLIDQEGGRVARMQPPEWPAFPPAALFGRLYDIAPASAIAAARANAHALGLMLAQCGINVDCLPLLDVRRAGADDVIGDRAFGFEPMRVAALGRAVLAGLAEAGVIGVVKHMPGHGRVLVDSHKALPVVTAGEDELAEDLAPFIRLADAPIGMSAHIVYTAWDADRPGTLSPAVIDGIIRRRIGFDGLLLTDDIDMKALSGTPAEKAVAALAAGCDIVLDCWARMDEMTAIAAAVPPITAAARDRLDRAMIGAGRAPDLAVMADLVATRDRLLAPVVTASAAG
ncbi:beta-N-acetylhexosaminidase [Sphingomonas changnyeongensis]|uniref:beta-N-acetylhexosaminidase n=1 Tax=Sphingomonas changnyeongensis TaxID=2698679 RepID=A0A7Z2NUQ4_9SPHN|nr:beta-N-acetylhexosaminidase [Sphingomonas changnyeongensis]QHL89584.1 beta-N-acetylhexosaminidase [Sphingomonas changnyeongensis]